MRKTKTPAKHRLLLDRYSRVADGVALLFFPYVEIVIHDLQSQTVAYIANNLSKREVGDESALEEIDHSAESGTVGPYEKVNWDGRRMRCVSTVLFDDAGVAAGMMCVNYNIAVFEDIKQVIDRVITGAGIVKQPEELFKDDWQERINTFLHAWLQERQLALNSLSRDNRRELVEALWAEGHSRARAPPTMSRTCSEWDARPCINTSGICGVPRHEGQSGPCVAWRGRAPMSLAWS